MLRGRLGIALLIAVRAIAAAGVARKFVWMTAPRWASTILYLGMGWAALLVVKPIIRSASAGFLMWIVLGGIFYSLGAVVYATKRPNPAPNAFGFHEIWHLFVLAGSSCHYVAVLGYIAHAS